MVSWGHFTSHFLPMEPASLVSLQNQHTTRLLSTLDLNIWVFLFGPNGFSGCFSLQNQPTPGIRSDPVVAFSVVFPSKPTPNWDLSTQWWVFLLFFPFKPTQNRDVLSEWWVFRLFSGFLEPVVAFPVVFPLQNPTHRPGARFHDAMRDARARALPSPRRVEDSRPRIEMTFQDGEGGSTGSTGSGGGGGARGVAFFVWGNWTHTVHGCKIHFAPAFRNHG